MPNPVEILGRTSHRIAQVAAVRTLAYAFLPIAVAVALAASLNSLGRLTWERWGYVLSGESARMLGEALIALAALTLIIGVALAIRSYLHARDFIGAAEQVDEAVGGHQQILTLATLADPAAPDSVKALRSPLFPILWQSAIRFLETFDAKRAFPFALGRPLARSSVFAVAVAFATILATLGLVRPPSPLQTEATRLRELAAEIEKSSTSPSDITLAKSVRDAADALENPKLPPEEKVKRLQEVMHEVESHKDEKQGGGKEKGEGAGGGSSAQNSKGEGKGAGEAQSAGNSNKPGSGAGQNGEGKGSGPNDKGNQQGKDSSIEIQKELTKAEAQIESGSPDKQNPMPQAGGDKDQGNAPKPGNNPNEKGGGNEPKPNEPGNAPTQGARGDRNVPQRGSSQPSGSDQGSNQGDTHLGEFPTPTKTQRFLKPGEKGDALNIHDARYVMFRLPNAAVVGSGGTTVLDPNRTKSSTPYTNAPLKETSNDAPPDERQLVPPRYRDLIH
ncbi:MAG: hypothetical protein ACLQDV_04420 [Candidatus Binataceae bacterium]